MNLDIALQPAPVDATAAAPLLDVDDLAVAYTSGRIARRVVQGVSFSIARGEVLALVRQVGVRQGHHGAGGARPAAAQLPHRARCHSAGWDRYRALAREVVGWSAVRRHQRDPAGSYYLVQPGAHRPGADPEILEIHGERDRDRFRTACWTCCAASGSSPPRCGRASIRTGSQAVCARAWRSPSRCAGVGRGGRALQRARRDGAMPHPRPDRRPAAGGRDIGFAKTSGGTMAAACKVLIEAGRGISVSRVSQAAKLELTELTEEDCCSSRNRGRNFSEGGRHPPTT